MTSLRASRLSEHSGAGDVRTAAVWQPRDPVAAPDAVRAKSDLERDVPLPDWAAASVRVHLARHKPWACTLPWEKLNRKPCTCRLLFQWADGSHVRYRSYSEQVWKPALAAAGVIPAPGTDRRGAIATRPPAKKDHTSSGTSTPA